MCKNSSNQSIFYYDINYDSTYVRSLTVSTTGYTLAVNAYDHTFMAIEIYE